MNILTEREFLSVTSVEATQIRDWINQGIMRPIQTLGDRLIYLKKHVKLVENIKQLMQHGLTIEQIKPYVENEVVDVEQVLQQQNVEERTIEFFQSLSYDELVSRCQEERIVGFRRMTREEMEICLAYPERREEIIEQVRERNRQRSQTNRGQVQEETVSVNNREEILNMTYTQLVQKAKEARIPNFRRMTKEELQLCFLGSEEEVQRLIEEVRERTRQRYGSGSGTSVQNQELMEATVEEMEEDLVEETDEENNVEENELETSVERTVVPQSNEVPYSYEELMAMNSKQVAVVVRDYLDIKYFRRMTKEELITCIFYPERREEMVAIAAARYELYRGRRYGRNARNNRS